MRYSVVAKRAADLKGDLLVCGVTEDGAEGLLKDLDDEASGLIRRVFDTGEMKGKLLETARLHVKGRTGTRQILLVGLGIPSEINVEILRTAGGTAARAARMACVSRVVVDLQSFCRNNVGPEGAAFALVEGAGLSLYRFLEHKSDKGEIKKDPSAFILAIGREGSLAPVRKALGNAQIMIESTCIARNLANQPGNFMTPSIFTRFAKKISSEAGLSLSVIGRDRMKALGMGGILAVSAGSNETPKLVVIEHRGGGKKGDTVVVVGKGITFDSGGISIKPSEKMEEMKFDKAGACSVLGIMNAVARLDLPLNVVGLMPLCENLPGGRAYKPGDVVKMHSGKTVEVISTDAEGRMILADALSFSLKYSPDAILDLATLTGACIIALGFHTTAIIGNDPGLVDKVKAAGERTGERAWDLPSWKVYQEQLQSEIADLQNVGGRDAGTITAGLFLKEFVGDVPWVHLDIAGTAWVKKDLPYIPKGASGVGVRLVTDLLSNWGSKDD